MARAVVTCDRCHKDVEGTLSRNFTGGFYMAKAWSAFTNENEDVVCDACMFADPRYIKVYGQHTA